MTGKNSTTEPSVLQRVHFVRSRWWEGSPSQPEGPETSPKRMCSAETCHLSSVPAGSLLDVGEGCLSCTRDPDPDPNPPLAQLGASFLQGPASHHPPPESASCCSGAAHPGCGSQKAEGRGGGYLTPPGVSPWALPICRAPPTPPPSGCSCGLRILVALGCPMTPPHSVDTWGHRSTPAQAHVVLSRG